MPLRRTLLLLLAAAVVAVAPLVVSIPVESPFTGADGQAMDAIQATHPDYRRWAAPLWEPPSDEIESLLFALQASLGAGVLGYVIGIRRGRAERRRPPERADADGDAAAGTPGAG